MDSSFAVSGPSHVRPEEYTTPMITNLATYARNMLAVHIQLCPVSTNHSVIRFLYVSVKRWSYVQFKSDLFGHTLSFSCDTYYKGVKHGVKGGLLLLLCGLYSALRGFCRL